MRNVIVGNLSHFVGPESSQDTAPNSYPEPKPPILSVTNILILSSHMDLGIQRGPPLSYFPMKILYALFIYLFPPMRATCSASLTLFYL